jgi:transcription antitermination factor NusG
MLVSHDIVSTQMGADVAVAKWYAVQTRSRFEKTVRAEFALSEIEHYLATYLEVHEWKDRKKTVELPLFPGYIFVRLEDVNAARMQVLRTNGVVRILSNGGSMEPVPDEQIESIRRLLGAGQQCYPHPFIREGSWVRVRRGVLAGVEGRLVRFKNDMRLVVSIDLLSQSVATEIDARNVEPVPEPRRKQD